MTESKASVQTEISLTKGHKGNIVADWYANYIGYADVSISLYINT